MIYEYYILWHNKVYTTLSHGLINTLLGLYETKSKTVCVVDIMEFCFILGCSLAVR